MNTELDANAKEILECISDGFFAVDHHWRLLYVNQLASAVVKRHCDDLLGKVIWNELGDLACSRFENACRQVADERVPASLTVCNLQNDEWYELRIYPMSYGLSVYFKDVTRQRQLEQARAELAALRERERRIYQTALSNSTDFNYVLDLDSRFIYANERLLSLWQKKLADAVGKNFYELGYPRELVERLQRQIRQVIDTRETICDDTYLSACGKGQYENIFSPVLAEDGTVVAVSGSTRDISDRRQAAEALRKMHQRKDEFLAILAHELRNPLASLSSWLGVLQHADCNPELARKAPEVMERQISQLIRLVNDLMDLNRITRGVVELRKEPVQLAALLQQAVETVQHLIDDGAHPFKVDISPGDVLMNVDPARIVQVMTNLLSNAIKFTDHGGLISLSARREADHIAVCVTDHGIGIAPDMQPRVFDIFTHVDDSVGRPHNGLGIGLSLVKGFVELHDGSVEVRSEGHGRGSEFTVRLPVASAPLPAKRLELGGIARR
ncbi:MAG: hypothetical protein JWR68_2390 [Polaromonas sp.]|nr:hypothetical protein [Polaromonas sp.]